MTPTLVPGAASADRLTEALRRSGALDTGRVSGVEVSTSRRRLRSQTVRLRLTYEGQTEKAPSSLILKIGQCDAHGRPISSNRREIDFYRRIAPILPKDLVPLTHDVVGATEVSPWHLLLEDLTDTHVVATEHPLPPSPSLCRRIVERWGELHASLWDDPHLHEVSPRAPAALWAEYLRLSADRYAAFIDRFGDMLPASRRPVYERLLGDGVRLLDRLEPGRHLTLSHGDAHWWNCLVPRDGSHGHVRLVDWEDCAVGLGAMDLAYMMAMLWFPERRRAAEKDLLDCYHETLSKNGVVAYSRDMLTDDYRSAVLLQVLRPVWQATSDRPPSVWWPNLERNFLAFEDLHCRDLLG